MGPTATTVLEVTEAGFRTKRSAMLLKIKDERLTIRTDQRLGRPADIPLVRQATVSGLESTESRFGTETSHGFLGPAKGRCISNHRELLPVDTWGPEGVGTKPECPMNSMV